MRFLEEWMAVTTVSTPRERSKPMLRWKQLPG